MSDIKISQLPNTTIVNNPDLFPISHNMGGSNWESESISAFNLAHSLGTSRLLVVAKDGIADANTIKDAVDIAVTLSPTETNPVEIQVFSGSYIENNPIIIPPWVTIYSESGQYSVEVIASNMGNIFVAGQDCILNGFSIFGLDIPSNGNTALYANGQDISTPAIMQNCYVRRCQKAVVCDNGYLIIQSVRIGSFNRLIDTCISVINGGYLRANECSIKGITTRPTYAYSSIGTGSELYLFSCIAENCVNGIYTDNSGYVDNFSNHYELCDNAIHVGSTGSCQIKCLACCMDNDNTLDLNVESANANVAYMGHIDSAKFSVVNNATINIIANDQNIGGGLILGKSSLQGKVSIGYPGAIASGADLQLNIGDGSAFVNDNQGNPIVEYWAYDASLHSFTRFANNAGTQFANSGDALIIGCKFIFPAIRIDVDVAAVLGTADFVTEYWNGSSWTQITVAGYKKSTFERRANMIFQNVETQFIDFSVKLYEKDISGDYLWQADINQPDNIPNWTSGERYYAVRFRNDGALTSGMQFANGLVKPDSFMVSTSGKKANFGIYRTSQTQYIDSMTFTRDATNPPSYGTLQMSTHISYADQPVFTKANSVSQISTAFTIPGDLDTSSPVTIRLDGVALSSATGNVVSTIYIGRVDFYNPPPSMPISDIEIGPEVTAMPGITNGFFTIVQDVDASSYNPRDVLMIGFARLASDGSDNYSGDIIIGDLTFNYQAKFLK